MPASHANAHWSSKRASTDLFAWSGSHAFVTKPRPPMTGRPSHHSPPMLGSSYMSRDVRRLTDGAGPARRISIFVVRRARHGKRRLLEGPSGRNRMRWQDLVVRVGTPGGNCCVWHAADKACGCRRFCRGSQSRDDAVIRPAGFSCVSGAACFHRTGYSKGRESRAGSCMIEVNTGCLRCWKSLAARGASRWTIFG